MQRKPVAAAVTLDVIRGERDNMELTSSAAYGNIGWSNARLNLTDFGRWLVDAGDGGCLDQTSQVKDRSGSGCRLPGWFIGGAVGHRPPR